MSIVSSWRRNRNRFSLSDLCLAGSLVAASTLLRLALLPVPRSIHAAEAEEAKVSSPSFERIDAHAHVFVPSPRFYEMLGRLNMRVITICVVDKHDLPIYKEAEPQLKMALDVYRQSQGRVAWISTFDPQDWETPGFAERVNKRLDETFQDGAVGVKIYKSIGMELKSKAGKYLLPDDPVFDPILEHIAAKHKTLYAHIAEPLAAWQPLDPTNPDSMFYSEEPNHFWYMYGHPERPSKETILAARDRMLKRHPTLRVVGCHLGSMEEDVDEIAKRFDLYPNFVVDTGARVDDLMVQPHDKVRAFLIKYQDRILYGSDESLIPSEKGQPDDLKSWQDQYAFEWKYLATSDTVEYRGRKIQGLALPEPVLRKICHDNAVKWVPGIVEPAVASTSN